MTNGDIWLKILYVYEVPNAHGSIDLVEDKNYYESIFSSEVLVLSLDVDL